MGAAAVKEEAREAGRIHSIREAEKESHEQAYASMELYQRGSWLAKPVKTVMELLPLLDDADTIDTLDLGCGVGRNAIAVAQYFKDRPCRIDGVDLLPMAIQKLMENAERHAVSGAIRGSVSTIEAFPVKEDSYDLILAVSALEHVESETLFVQKLWEIKRGLRNGGVACLIINSEVREWDSVTGAPLSPQFEVNLPTEEMVQLLEAVFAGEIIKLGVCPQKYQIPRGKKTARLTTNVVTVIAGKPRQGAAMEVLV